VSEPRPIDVRHLGNEQVIGSYLLDTDDGPALFDPGPASALDGLRRGLEERGVELAEIRHLLLSHVHLDHAGASGVIVREHPHVTVHVSEVGAPHLVDPSRLEASARRLYGEAFDALWGELAPIPQANVRVAGERVLGLECFPTPGHASHHVCYLDAAGTLYAGDAAGVRIPPSTLVLPPTPPPDLDVEAWDATLDDLERHAPARLALVHFGVFDDVPRHLDELRARLHEWESLVAGGASQDEFEAAVHTDATYDQAMPLWQSYAGLKRWVDTVKPTRSPASGAA
jgi:glyoxylase-like metal-dependent hydrolase (beta-lactamase superfamily II)